MIVIPKIIWQTYETSYDEIIPQMKEFSDTWKDKNPAWKYMYMDRQQREDFVLHEFGEEWHNLFKNCKLGVVQANIWRIMVLYIYGGVYSDFDAWCIDPIESWIKEDYSLTMSMDDDGESDELCIIAFAATPGSPALKVLLDQIKINIENNEIIQRNVVELTGEMVWTRVLLGNDNLYNFYCYPEGSNLFNGKAVGHLGTRKTWWQEGYNQWLVDGKYDDQHTDDKIILRHKKN
jgi:mannosyltransferase OCH1-like enzyme